MTNQLLLGTTEKVDVSDSAATTWTNPNTAPVVVRLCSDIQIRVKEKLKVGGSAASLTNAAYVGADFPVEVSVSPDSDLSFIGHKAATSGVVTVTVVR